MTTFAQTVLDQLKPTIDKMVASIAKHVEAQTGYPTTKRDIEYFELVVSYDLLKAVGNYTNSSDELISFTTRTSVKGNIEIDAIVKRDGSEHTFITEAIYAGGYNIQRLHYRYIVKTNLPKESDLTLANEYAAKIKRFNKIEKLQSEIDGYKKQISIYQARIDAHINLSDDEIYELIKLEKDYRPWPTWNQIVENGAAVNYNNDEELFNNKGIESKSRSIEFFKSKNIKWPSDSIKSLNKSITKLENKIAQA